MTKKLVGLDLGRFIASVIVCVGHMGFVPTEQVAWSSSQILFAPFRYGNLSVKFFFCLSGFVLVRNSPRINFGWLISRGVRLLPLYWFAFFIPAIAWIIYFKQIPGGFVGSTLEVFGMHSLSARYYLNPPNPPLWSLSVEILLSVLLFLSYRFGRNIQLAITLILPITLLLFENVNPLLGSLPYFYLGVSISLFRPTIKNHILRFLLTILSIFIIFTLRMPIKRGLDAQQEIAVLISIGCLILLLQEVNLSTKLSRLVNYFANRTYSLYAIHYPVIFGFSAVIRIFEFNMGHLTYFFTQLLLICCCAELTYRFIEQPSLNLSRSLRSRFN